MTEKLLDYFNKDELAANVWLSKYAQEGEETPDDMHRRMAKEFARIELNYANKSNSDNDKILSEYGKVRNNLTEESIYNLFKDFKYIIPQGSIMSQLGAKSIGSLSNCFVIGQPEDSYGGIFQKDEEMAQLMKRRGGVGIDISKLRPIGTSTSNAAKTSTGAISFMHRFSNTTREVAQNGRRGALMISIDINHPDVMEFIKIKRDLSQVTGANISIKLNNKFMKSVENDEDYILRFPCDLPLEDRFMIPELEHNNLTEVEYYKGSKKLYLKKIRAREYWDEIIKSAHNVAEPGIIFVDNHHNYSPDGVYEQYKGVTTNPCFHPDTLIETEYGRIKIKDMNFPMRVYSMDLNGKLVMSNASSSFISKKNTKTLKITLKNGSNIQVTPEHKLWVQNIGWVEAKDLKVGNQLGHLCRSRRGSKYAGVHLTTSPNKQKDQIMEHKLVYGEYNANMDIHHIDRDTYNNSIDNLKLLSHSEHSKITALEDNPQTHQERDKLGKFISGKNSNYGRKTIIDLPERLKTNMLSKYHNVIVSIEEGETVDVYDIKVENTHCLIANNIIAHNCGEIFMQEYDACRLIAINLYSFVKNPFTDKAKFDYKKFYQVNYEAMRLSDDLIELELEHIDRILDKLVSDPEDSEIKEREIALWLKVKSTAKSSRRTGLGFTALGDTLAALGLKYDSDEALEIIEQIMKTKMESELDCTIDLAILRGTFESWDKEKEFGNIVLGSPVSKLNGLPTKTSCQNNFYLFLREYFPEQVNRMCSYGRRNVSWSTVAPTGTVSLMTQTTSGIEPLFQPFYIRRKKVNPNDENVRIDFTDQNGDNWQEFAVLHPKFRDFIIQENDGIDVISILEKEDLEKWFTLSPWYGSTANDIDWIKRAEIQSIIQKYITHSISSTINLPEDVSEEEVSKIYLESWKKGLKGITVYRDGSRSGVLVSDKKNISTEEFNYIDAIKRPKEIKGEAHTTKVKGESFTVIVGIINNKPYEVFLTKASIKGEGLIIKQKKGEYDFVQINNSNSTHRVLTDDMTDEQAAITRLVSTSLRHGADIKFIVEQLNKADGDLFSFTKGLARVLKKYIPDGVKSTIKCNECGSDNVIFEEGCSKCLSCGNSKCG